MMEQMNIVFCVNDGYVNQLCTVITSILFNNPTSDVHFFVVSSDFSESSKQQVAHLYKKFKNWDIKYIYPDLSLFDGLKLNIDYISKETYFRYLLGELLPELDKVLYLDADIVVNGNLSGLYNTDIAKYYLAGVKDLYIDDQNHKQTIGLTKDDLYINAGVLLMNLVAFRKHKLGHLLINNTKTLAKKIKYQDQDVINITCNGHILQVPNIYNFASHDMLKNKKSIHNAIILHFTGAIKPWNAIKHHKRFNIWFKYYSKYKQVLKHKKIKVALLIDEFFGGAGTAFGGYGFLARKYIAKYIPNTDIKIDVLLGNGGHRERPRKYRVDNVNLYRLPRKHFWSRVWLWLKNYDLYLSIELTDDWVLKHEPRKNKKLILWIQDPRPKSAWDNVIDSMQSIKDPCFFQQHIYDTVNAWNKQGKVTFISQGYCLNKLAFELYDLPSNTPVQYLPNPIELDMNYKFDIKNKKKRVIFLGRLEAQKRAWLFCEIAKRMPEYEFYVLGQFFRYKEDNERMLKPYMNGDIKNLHFVGHVDGDTKSELIKSARVLCSTAIWEGIPISWLECLSYGTVLVSDLEREDLVSRFGTFTGDNLGDGFDGVDSFIPAIREFMENDKLYSEKAKAAIEYIRKTHNIPRFVNDLRTVIYKEVK